MISEIGFLVKKSRTAGMKAALAYAGGVTLGAAVLGGLLGALGSVGYWLVQLRVRYDNAVFIALIGGLCIIGALIDASLIRCPIIGPKTQLPRHYMTVFSPQKTGFLWGLFVGFAQKTRFGYFIYSIIALWSLLSGSWTTGMMIMGTYGATQGALLVIEILAIGASARLTPNDGLLGYGRSSYFFGVSSFALMTLGVANLSPLILAALGGNR